MSNHILSAEFWAHVNKDGGDAYQSDPLAHAVGKCWTWDVADHSGYGVAVVNGKSHMAHRAAYEALNGAIPAGLHIDHLCRNRICVNPDHLEPVTQRTNILRGAGHTALNARKTRCVHGHEFTPENTYMTTRGSRACRTCRRALHADRKRRRRLERKSA